MSERSQFELWTKFLAATYVVYCVFRNFLIAILITDWSRLSVYAFCFFIWVISWLR